MSEVPYEIVFLPVGTGDSSGDAIAVRWLDEHGQQRVLVYDGGTQASGEQLVAHVRARFGTNRVDYVVSSHPDADHASGLSVILEQLEVGELWMLQPWAYSPLIRGYFDGRFTSAGLADRLRKKMACANEVAKLAARKGIAVREPFEGAWIGGRFLVLSPNRDWYVHELIPAFEKSPAQKAQGALTMDALGLGHARPASAGLLGGMQGFGLSDAPVNALAAIAGRPTTSGMNGLLLGMGSARPTSSLFSSGGLLMREAERRSALPQTMAGMGLLGGMETATPASHFSGGGLLMPKAEGRGALPRTMASMRAGLGLSDARAPNQGGWGVDSLREDVETSAENESSVVLLGFMGSRGALLTGDAGVKALSRAAAYCEAHGLDLPSFLQFVQVPHHGSRNNVSTSVLDRIVGSRKAQDDDGRSDKYAFISVGMSKTHPRQRVVNAFVRRGATVVATQGVAKCYACNLGRLPAYWTAEAKPLQFSRSVEPWPAE